MKSELLAYISTTAASMGIPSGSFSLEYPENPDHGDFSTNIAMVNAKEMKMAPKALADKLIEALRKDVPAFIESVSVAGPGFINFKVSAASVKKDLEKILGDRSAFGKSNVGEGRTVVVEYSSPNIAKPFTVGHLRSTIIGDSIANLLAMIGYTVIRDNHLGDWGTQFGKLLVMLDEKGVLEEIKKTDQPVKKLVDLYVAFHDEVDRLRKDVSEDAAVGLEEKARARFQVLESDVLKGNEDSELVKKWKICIDLSKKEFDRVYKRLGVEFDAKRGDTELGESFYIDKSGPVIEQLKSKKLLKESEGAQVVFFDGEKYPPLIIEKSDGTSIYATRDLAADWYRKQKYGMKGNPTVINEVGSEQSLYFKQLFEIERMLGWFDQNERIHIAHGLYRFKDGKMSTRKGNVIWLDDIIDEAVSRAAKINTDSAEDVAVAAIKFNDLKRDSVQDIVFDWDEMMNMTGDSGPYLQYSCVRAKAIIEKAAAVGVKPSLFRPHPGSASLNLLERQLIRFADIVAFAGSTYKPNVVANYLINLAGLFNSFYSQNTIVDAADDTSSYKVAVTEAFSIIMENGLNILGIRIPKRM
jgi:arginyl-tRNA synthetase